MHVLRTVMVSMLSLYDPLINDNSIEANQKKAVKLMAQTATIVTSFNRLRSGEMCACSWRSQTGFRRELPLHAVAAKKPDAIMEKTSSTSR